jgi:hypothetical protein
MSHTHPHRPAGRAISVGAAAAAAAILLLPAPARSESTKLRLDPEVLSGRLAQYLLGETEVESLPARSGGLAQFPGNIQLSDEHFAGRLISQTEPSIAANPANPANLVAGFHDLYPTVHDFVCRYTVTFDGGATWSLAAAGPLTAQGHFCSDPALTADGDGTFYYAYLEISNGATNSDVIVSRSTDGGLTFAPPVIAARGIPSVNFPDKEYIAADAWAGSPHRGTVYVSWTDFLNPTDHKALDNGQIKIVASRDGGATWSQPIAISHSAQYPEAISGSLPVVAPDGTVYVFYADFISNTGPLSIRFAKSADGGRTWSAPADVASGLNSPGRFRLRNADPNFGTVPGAGFRSNSFPTAAIGPDGAISVAWADFPKGSCRPDGSGRPACFDSDVRLARSTDGGASWSTPADVSDDTGTADQFFAWSAAHPDGRVSLIWQDKRLDAANSNFDTFYSSTADGRVFTANVRVSTATSRAGLTTFIGDYNNLALAGDALHGVWTDRRFGNNDIFTARGILP